MCGVAGFELQRKARVATAGVVICSPCGLARDGAGPRCFQVDDATQRASRASRGRRAWTQEADEHLPRLVQRDHRFLIATDVGMVTLGEHAEADDDDLLGCGVHLWLDDGIHVLGTRVAVGPSTDAPFAFMVHRIAKKWPKIVTPGEPSEIIVGKFRKQKASIATKGHCRGVELAFRH
jgi:hypothetical protein